MYIAGDPFLSLSAKICHGGPVSVAGSMCPSRAACDTGCLNLSRAACACHRQPVCREGVLSVTGGLCLVMGGRCLSRVVCVRHGRPVSVTGGLCPSQAACIHHRRPVSVTGGLCPSRAACVRHGQFVSVTGGLCRRDWQVSVTGGLCLSWAAQVQPGVWHKSSQESGTTPAQGWHNSARRLAQVSQEAGTSQSGGCHKSARRLAQISQEAGTCQPGGCHKSNLQAGTRVRHQENLQRNIFAQNILIIRLFLRSSRKLIHDDIFSKSLSLVQFPSSRAILGVSISSASVLGLQDDY